MSGFRIFVAMFLFLATGALSCRQIYFSGNDNNALNCDFGYYWYPVVNLPKNCLLKITDFCDIRDFHRGLKEELCDLHSHCPNGTQAQCVQNVESPAYDQAIIICVPIDLQCEAFSRFVAYVDTNVPGMYRLCKKSCDDGYIHFTKSGTCFNHCFENSKITVFRKSTSNSSAVVYCDYLYRLCNPNNPKLFEYSEQNDGCLSHNDIKCPTEHDRLPDCTCSEKCKMGDVRKPENDFRCESESSISSEEAEFNPQVTITPFHNKLQVSWKIAESIVVNFIEVGYKPVNAPKMKTLPAHTGSEDPVIDVNRLTPGQLYFIRVTFFYLLNNKSETGYLDKYIATNPPPILDLRSEFVDRNITLVWDAPENNSVYQHFKVEYRMVARNPKTSWMYLNTTANNITFDSLFPGEEYEFRIYVVSNTSSSKEKALSVIIPPLSPEEIRIERIAYMSNSYSVSWLKYDSKSHVDGWLLSYHSNEDKGNNTYIPWSENGELISITLTNLQAGQKYSVMVKGKSKGVFSTSVMEKEIETPKHWSEELDHSLRDLTKLVIGTCIGFGVVGVVAALIVVIFLFVKKTFAGRTITRIVNNYSIRDINANVNASNIHMNNTLDNLISESWSQITSTTSSASSTVLLSDSSDNEL